MRNSLIMLLLFTALLTACANTKSYYHKTGQLPGQIYVHPALHVDHDAVVGIFDFNSPNYATGAGRIAAESLYKELMKKGISARPVFEFNPVLAQKSGSLARFARQQGVDLLIFGEVSCFMHGGNHLNAIVCKEIRILEPVGERLYIVGHASSCITGKSTPAKDYIFFRIRGKPSAHPMELSRTIALQFANMFPR